MKTVLNIFLIALSIQLAFGQNVNTNSLFLTDSNGKPFKQGVYSEYLGSPFLNDEFVEAKVVFKNGTGIDRLMSRINLYTNEVHYLNKEGVEYILPKGFVEEITLRTHGTLQTFRTGYAKTDRLNENTFYKVIVKGKITLLEHNGKALNEKSDYNTEYKQKVFNTTVALYLYKEGRLSKLKKSNAHLREWMNDKNEQVDDFLKNNALNLKDETAIIKLIEYYNSLH